MEPELKKRILELFVKAREELLAPPIFLRKVVIGEELRVRIALTMSLPRTSWSKQLTESSTTGPSRTSPSTFSPNPR